MDRKRQRRAAGRLPILSAAALSAIGLLWDGARSSATAQTFSGASSDVIVNYDVLDALPGQPAPDSGRTPKSQFLPGYAPAPGTLGAATALPPYTPYGAFSPGAMTPAPLAPGLPGGLAAPPPGMPTSVLTTLGPDGRPVAPIKLKKPGADAPAAQKPKKEFAAPVQTQPDSPTETAGTTETTADSAAALASEAQGTDSQIAAVTPPEVPSEVPAEVPMPEPTPPAPAAGENAAPAVESPAPSGEAEAPAAEAPATKEPAEQPEEAPAAEQASQEQPAEQEPAAEATAPEGEAAAPAEAPAEEPAEEQSAEEAAAEPAPDAGQPAPPIPQGGIRIVFPVDLNEVPVEANAALDDLAAQMLADESMRIQILCYASGTEETESKARRKSLARCINIRQYLFKKDVRTTRMDVRALGLKSEGEPADRVDIIPANS